MLSAAEGNVPYLQGIISKYYDIYFNFAIEYENLNMTVSDFKMICAIIMGLCAGIIAATFISLFNKKYLGDFVRTVIGNDALSAENAKTLYELGYVDKLMLRYAVAKSVSLRRVVKCREEEAFYEDQKQRREEYEKNRADGIKLKKFKEIEYKVDPDNDHFFIPEELKYTAEVKFDKKGATLRAAIAISVITVIAFFIMMLALPQLLEFLNGIAAPTT